MSYEHDIFISYRRDCPTTDWMKKVFLTELKRHLTPLRRDGIDIFDDDQIQVASRWQQVIHKKITASRLLLPMLTPYYFGSDWCRRELALMLEREELLRLRFPEHDERGLVIPICLYDGFKFPPRLKDIQLGVFKDYTDARRNSKKWDQFSDKVKVLAATIDQILDNVVPDYEPAWLSLTGETVEPQLRIPSSTRKTPPRLTDAPM